MAEKVVLLLVLATLIAVAFAGCTVSPSPAAPEPTPARTAAAETRPAEVRPPQTQAPSPTAAPASPTATSAALASDLVTVRQVERDPEAFRDRRVHMRGHGVIAATLPLCAGYVGLDRRTRFVDAEQALMVAVVQWKPPEGGRLYDPDRLRVFDGHIRIFSGEIGCPGATRVETFPYFEIIGAE
ncbi:MAG: hypothetical protein ACP5UQ_12715 [Anaerolineae bacterium]